MKHPSAFIATLLLLTLTASCKKDKIIENQDYRDAYTGNYSGLKVCTFWTIDMPAPDTTFIGVVNMVVTKVTSATDLIVVQDDTIPIDQSGHYFGFYAVPGFNDYRLDFRNDSIFLRTFSGGLGGGTTCNTVGKK